MNRKIPFFVSVCIFTCIAVLDSCKKDSELPTIATKEATAVTVNSVTVGGEIIIDGGAEVIARGVCWDTGTGPDISDSHSIDGTGTGNFVCNLEGLLPGTVYFVRAYATNNAGTIYGNEITFTTLAADVPDLTTTALTSITLTTAVLGGDITLAGAGSIIARGVCWSTNPDPTKSDSRTSDTSGTGSFISNLTGLIHGTTYYVRAFATNNIGTGYGNQVTFDTKLGDVEGNTYNIVTIGTQVWMKENLKTSKYNNGDNIGTTTSLDISGELTPKYQWAYGDNEANVAVFGRLYTFYSVTDLRGVCPTGWHAPSEAEWIILRDYLTNNGFGFEGSGNDIAKSMASASGWETDPTPGNIGNDQSGNNRSGFTALPGGFRKGNDGIFYSLNQKGFWGTTSEGGTSGRSAWYHALNYNDKILGANDFGPWNGYSVRCLKD